MMSALLKEAGNECTLDIWQNMPHLFQMADEYLTEAHDALQKFSAVISGIEKNTGRQTFENKPRLENSLRSEA